MLEVSIKPQKIVIFYKVVKAVDSWLRKENGSLFGAMCNGGKFPQYYPDCKKSLILSEVGA